VTTFARAVGRNIRRTRQAAGLNKKALAEHAGLHWTVIVAYEGGHGVPILESFVMIAVALGVSPCELLPGLEWDPLGSRLD
jgi:transcriptional regulator with XRE-family HTH domain